MTLTRRQLLLALPPAALLSTGCAGMSALPPLQIRPAPAPTEPTTMRAPALGQRWTYHKYNGYNGARLATETDEVVALQPNVRVRRSGDAPGAAPQEEIHESWGTQSLTLRTWDHALRPMPALPLWPQDLRPGARSAHSGHYFVDDDSYRYWISQHTTVGGWETVTLQGSERRALRVEHLIRLQHPDFNRVDTVRRDTLWLAPETGRWIAREVSGEFRRPTGRSVSVEREDWFRWELVDWR
ncbi:MAG: hypothetical protein ACK5YJ_00365 [Curvibacter sp.]|jgi:hypothetical protein|nr:hypothetical protein [Curvibacter sp.]